MAQFFGFRMFKCIPHEGLYDKQIITIEGIK